YILESKRLVWLVAVVFAVIIMFQYFEFPYGDVASSMFTVGRVHPSLSHANQTKSSAESPKSSDNITVFYVSNHTKPVDAFSNGNNIGVENHIPSNGSTASPPLSLPASLTAPTTVDNTAVSPTTALDNNTIKPEVNGPSSDPVFNKPVTSENRPAVSAGESPAKKVPRVKTVHERPIGDIVTLSDMHDILRHNRASVRSMKPLQSSIVDQQLLDAKLQIENAPILNHNDRALYPPLYRNVSKFKRSYELMEKILKVYVYNEGEKPIFHQPQAVLSGIYASEGWFMKHMKENKHFVTNNLKEAHLFYLPFSSRTLEEKLYVTGSGSRDNLVQHLKDYIQLIAGRYDSWNRTGGSDHFLVACHDWVVKGARRTEGVKGYEVNSPRVVEAIFHECVPVIISDNFVPPFFEILNWESFAVFVQEKDIPNLKNILLAISNRSFTCRHQVYGLVVRGFCCKAFLLCGLSQVASSSPDWSGNLASTLRWVRIGSLAMKLWLPSLHKTVCNQDALMVIFEQSFCSLMANNWYYFYPRGLLELLGEQVIYKWAMDFIEYSYFEFPYGDVISSLFSASKIHVTYGTNSTRSNCSTDTATTTTTLTSPQILLDSSTSETYKNASNLVHHFTKNEPSSRDIFPSADLSAVTEVHRKKQKVKVVSISEMRDILAHNRASSHSVKPLWTSRADQELLDAKLQIENASFNEDDYTLYPSVFRNISLFRSCQLYSPVYDICYRAFNNALVTIFELSFCCLTYFEFPYGDVISSLFSASKIHITYGINSTGNNRSTDNATSTSMSPQILLDSNMSGTYKNVSNLVHHFTKNESNLVHNVTKKASTLVHNFTKNESLTRVSFPSANLSAVTDVDPKKQKVNVVSISEMRDILVQNRASSHSMKPRWTSRADQELLNAKRQIEKASFNKDDHNLYPSVFRNISIFRRSYELMEKTLKVYIYKEGEKPIFHQPESIMKGIYASEGWFMMQMKSSKRFITKKPKQAHLFYIPYSSKLLKETLSPPNFYNRKSLVPYLKNYIDMISRRYNFWNRTGGADHFLVACHDWAPDETSRFMGTCIRAMCNTDVEKSGFELGKDVSLPETNIRNRKNPLQNLGGKPPSKRSVFAFFAGQMHGSLRPILLRYWENKDPDMKIFKKLPKVKDDKNYVDFMKNSKFCICAKGSQVNSARVVEAIFYECIPVIISDNYVPPFFEVLDWESFAVFIPEKDIPDLKNILLSIPKRSQRRN
ncbi:hypothetical protein M8C21_026196, partial [Ambrosia artemisiifolia]